MLLEDTATPAIEDRKITSSDLLTSLVKKAALSDHILKELQTEESIQISLLNQIKTGEGDIEKRILQVAQKNKDAFFSKRKEYIANYFLTYDLNEIQFNQKKITIDQNRLEKFLKQRPHLFLIPPTKLHQVIKKELASALEKDFNTYDSLKNRNFPIYSNPFQIVELKLHKPSDVISKTLDYLGSLSLTKTDKSLIGIIKKKYVQAMIGNTKKILKASNAITMFFRKNIDNSEQKTRLFNYLIEHFWRIQVGRPEYMEGAINTEDGSQEDDYLTFPEKGDEILRKEGFYPISKVFREKYASKIELVSHIAWSTLRAQIFQRENKPREICTPLPKRRKEGYWIVVETDINKDNAFKKIHIPWEKIGDSEATYEEFLAHVLQELENHDQKHELVGPETDKDIENELKKDILYDSKKNRENRKNVDNFYDADLRISINPTSKEATRTKRAFSNIKLNPVGSRTPTTININLQKIGSEFQTTDLTAVYAHALIDGKETEEELDFILDEVSGFNDLIRSHLIKLEKIKNENPELHNIITILLTEDDISEAIKQITSSLQTIDNDIAKQTITTLLKFDYIKKLRSYLKIQKRIAVREQNNEKTLKKVQTTVAIGAGGEQNPRKAISMRVLDTEEMNRIRDGQPKKEKSAQGVKAYEIKLGTNIKDKKDTTISNLYTNYSSGGEIHKRIKEKYGVLLNPYIIFNWALMLTLDINHVDFLDKDGAGLTPIPQKIPEELKLLLTAAKETQDLKPNYILAVMDYVNEFNDLRFKQTRRQGIDENGYVQIGAGISEVSKAAVGFMRKQVTGLAKRLLPKSNAFVNETFLVSFMTKPRTVINQENPGRHETRGFGTAADTVYSKFGGIGITNFGSSKEGVGWRGVLRVGKTDLIKAKFDTDPNNPLSDEQLEEKFSKELLKNIEALNQLFEKIYTTLVQM
jgi:hypothetical protein